MGSCYLWWGFGKEIDLGKSKRNGKWKKIKISVSGLLDDAWDHFEGKGCILNLFESHLFEGYWQNWLIFFFLCASIRLIWNLFFVFSEFCSHLLSEKGVWIALLFKLFIAVWEQVSKSFLCDDALITGQRSLTCFETRFFPQVIWQSFGDG